jgi:hypothetical protein
MVGKCQQLTSNRFSPDYFVSKHKKLETGFRRHFAEQQFESADVRDQSAAQQFGNEHRRRLNPPSNRNI